MHRPCSGGASDESATSASRTSVSASSSIGDASAMWQHPPTPSTRTPPGSPRLEWPQMAPGRQTPWDRGPRSSMLQPLSTSNGLRPEGPNGRGAP
eukprot:9494948-Pyramimonas_sp.AAC.2